MMRCYHERCTICVAQHKIQRGYLPSRTHSVHYIREEGFREAVSHFLRRERGNIEYTMEALTTQASPYKALPPN